MYAHVCLCVVRMCTRVHVCVCVCLPCAGRRRGRPRFRRGFKAALAAAGVSAPDKQPEAGSRSAAGGGRLRIRAPGRLAKSCPQPRELLHQPTEGGREGGLAEWRGRGVAGREKVFASALNHGI